jgi:hypothetical protein
LVIPEFDERGNLPPGLHRCTIQEIQARFGLGSPERLVETAELIELIRWARQADQPKLHRTMLMWACSRAMPIRHLQGQRQILQANGFSSIDGCRR